MVTTTQRWRALLRDTLCEGKTVCSRGFTCLERRAVPFTIEMSQPVILSTQRKLGYGFMLAEAAWILSGDNRVETIAPFSKKISSFSDDGKIFFGAYGPRISKQLDCVIETLKRDPGTRQAVLSIWRENPPSTRDVPCTLTVQWLFRENRLHCLMNMRSSDIWLGVPYDIFNFSMLSLLVAKKLSLSPEVLGTLTLYAGSSHLYEERLPAVRELIHSDELLNCPFSLDVLQACAAEDLAPTLWDFANKQKKS